jgi:hypothetical protein
MSQNIFPMEDVDLIVDQLQQAIYLALLPQLSGQNHLLSKACASV